MKTIIIRENKNLRYTKVYLPIIFLTVCIIISLFIFDPILSIVITVIAGIIFYKAVLPIYRYGIYINDEEISMISSRSQATYRWEDIIELKHEIRVKYHVLSLNENERSLHIPLENYHPEQVIKEILKHIPKKKIEEDSLKNLDQFYYYGRTIEKK